MRRKALIVATALGGTLVTGGWLMQRGLAGPTSINHARLFDDVFSHVQRYYVDTFPESLLYKRALDGMLYELHDPHTVYLGSERFRRLTESTTGRYGGVGIQIEPRDGWITVVTALPGTPAEKAGIATGDRIVEIEGKGTKGWTTEEAQKLIRGAPGTEVHFVNEKPGGLRVPIALTRREIHLRSVAHATLLRDRVGYVALAIFSESSEDDLRSAVDSLRAAGMRVLILDLRNNPGGLLEQGVRVSDLFLDAGQKVLSMRGRTRDANADFSARSRQRWPDMPMIALVDSLSASAAEILAGALQDHDRALLVGTATYGKGSAQSLIRLDDGALKLTTSRWYTPAGRSIDRPHAGAATSVEEDPDGAPVAGSVKRSRPTFKTDAGRVVLGGGGITPDVIASDTLTTGDHALVSALGRQVAEFRAAVADVAVTQRSAVTPNGDFVPTAAMRDALFTRLTGRGVKLDRTVYDAATGIVDRLLTSQVLRYSRGPEAEYQRLLRDSRAMQTALAIAAGAANQRELFERAGRNHP
ncbi:MAG: S41 family peptidase [Gemmatimonadaceae bacterium]